MNVGRTTYGVSFNTGISMAEYNEAPAGQTAGQTQGSILPGSTTVSEAMENVFPKDPTVAGFILGQLALAGNSLALRTGSGYLAAARKAIGNLRRGKGEAGRRAAAEIESLLEDTEVLERYRAALLES